MTKTKRAKRKETIEEMLPKIDSALKETGGNRSKASDLLDLSPSVEKKIKTMTTDPARVKRTDAGDPDKCPVFSLHEIYSNEDTRAWVREGCTTAGIGCVDCKGPLIDKVLEEQQPMRERAVQYEENPDLVKSIVAEGCEKARTIAKATLEEVRSAMGLDYR